MADSIIGIKINDLPEANDSDLSDNSVSVVDNGTTTRKTKLSTFATWISNKLGIGKMKEDITAINSSLVNQQNFTVTSAQNIASKYIHIGKIVVAFVCAKTTSKVTTINFGLPEPFHEGYIIEPVNSYDDIKYKLAYTNNVWNLTVPNGQIESDTWLRFPIIYITK